ncbi:MAG: nitronate monooxygenase, partial [Oscillospiraceae bacterium]
SGPCVFPVAVRMVWQVANAVKIPVVGLGGIEKWEDAIEMMMAGASAVEIGTAMFYDPYAPIKVIEGINNWLVENKIQDINEIVGTVKPW